MKPNYLQHNVKCHDMNDGDVVLVNALRANDPTGRRITDVPIVIQLENDTIILDVYLHDTDDWCDRRIVIPITELEAGEWGNNA